MGLGSAFFRGHYAAATQLAGVRVVAGADPCGARRGELARRHPGIPLYDDATVMFRETNADLAVIATDPSEHPRLAAAALNHGFHVLCEKPVALSKEGLDLLAHTCARRSDCALIAVHQYRYSPAWHTISRCSRIVHALGQDAVLDVRVDRRGHDPLAATDWRLDLERSGGLLADHIVHFVALGESLGWRPEPVGAARIVNVEGDETVSALLDAQAGSIRIAATRAAEERLTRVALATSGMAVTWTNSELVTTVAKRVVQRRTVPSLASREHADELYEPLYREVAQRIADRAWRTRRTAESLRISGALIALGNQAARADARL